MEFRDAGIQLVQTDYRRATAFRLLCGDVFICEERIGLTSSLPGVVLRANGSSSAGFAELAGSDQRD